jgi:hypothetical protein
MIILIWSFLLLINGILVHPADEAPNYRKFAAEHVVGKYKKHSDLASLSVLDIRMDDQGLRFDYNLVTDDGGFWRANGPAHMVGDHLEMTIESMQENREFKIHGRRYARKDTLRGTILKLDRRILLLMEDEHDRFCNELNLGLLTRPAEHGDVFSREIDDRSWKLPDLISPPDVASKIVPEPIVATVDSIAGPQFTFRRGAKDRLWVGMLLYVEIQPKDPRYIPSFARRNLNANRAFLQVTEVGLASCIAVMRDRPANVPRVSVRQGDKLHTRIPDATRKEGISELLDADVEIE